MKLTVPSTILYGRDIICVRSLTVLHVQWACVISNGKLDHSCYQNRAQNFCLVMELLPLLFVRFQKIHAKSNSSFKIQSVCFKMNRLSTCRPNGRQPFLWTETKNSQEFRQPVLRRCGICGTYLITLKIMNYSRLYDVILPSSNYIHHAYKLRNFTPSHSLLILLAKRIDHIVHSDFYVDITVWLFY